MQSPYPIDLLSCEVYLIVTKLIVNTIKIMFTISYTLSFLLWQVYFLRFLNTRATTRPQVKGKYSFFLSFFPFKQMQTASGTGFRFLAMFHSLGKFCAILPKRIFGNVVGDFSSVRFENMPPLHFDLTKFIISGHSNVYSKCP